MSLNETPTGERVHIAFFGKRNAGKSSLLNAVTGQDLAVVSDIAGTTTDPVYKSMELLPLGPVTVIDTPGYDDTGILGEERKKKTEEVLAKTDIAVLVTDAGAPDKEFEKTMLSLFSEYGIPHITVRNKRDLIDNAVETDGEIYTSAKNKTGTEKLKDILSKMLPDAFSDRKIVSDLISPGDILILVTPIDSAAPKGRLILPQQQTIRDILDAGGVATVTKEDRVGEVISSLKEKPRMVITDSQAFSAVAEQVPEDIPLTSFSVLMARYKGFLETATEGVSYIEKLKDGDTVLISEGCTHHRQCGDIGSVKLPAWLREYTGKNLNFEYTSGTGFAGGDEIKKYALVIHCGACMLRPKVMTYRANIAKRSGVPFTNYGTAIAYMKGTYKRAIDALKK